MRLTWLLLLFLIVTAVMAKVDIEDTDDEYETVDVIQEGGQEEHLTNPCNKHRCKRGEVCVLKDRQPKCECQTCTEPADVESKLPVCSTKNVTYQSECHLDRDHCLCKSRQEGCSDVSQDKVRLDYFHACKELTPCPEFELQTFPERMRDWLFRVMNDMVMRGYEEVEDYRELLENARADESHADAVIWKFCNLDIDPEDRHVTRRELMYIIASIKPMEHCLVPFLNGCDADNDNTISLVEWGECLGIDHEAIVDKCKPIQRQG